MILASRARRSPAGTEVAVIAKANFIFHELAKVFQRHRAVGWRAIGDRLLIFNQHRIRFNRRFRPGGRPRSCASDLPQEETMRPKSGLFFFPGPDIFELFLRVFERFFQQLAVVPPSTGSLAD